MNGLRVCMAFILMTAGQLALAKKPYEIGDLVGVWQTFDRKSNQRRLLLEISYDAYTNSFVGHVKRVTPNAGMSDKSKCDRCPKPHKNKPVLGLQSVWGLKPKVKNGGKFTGVYSQGSLLDPLTGKVHQLSLIVSRSGNIIKAKTMSGENIVSRAHTWMRVKSK